MSVEMFQRLGLKQNLEISFLKKGFKSCFTGEKKLLSSEFCELTLSRFGKTGSKHVAMGCRLGGGAGFRHISMKNLNIVSSEKLQLNRY